MLHCISFHGLSFFHLLQESNHPGRLIWTISSDVTKSGYEPKEGVGAGDRIGERYRIDQLPRAELHEEAAKAIGEDKSNPAVSPIIYLDGYCSVQTVLEELTSGFVNDYMSYKVPDLYRCKSNIISAFCLFMILLNFTRCIAAAAK